MRPAPTCTGAWERRQTPSAPTGEHFRWQSRSPSGVSSSVASPRCKKAEGAVDLRPPHSIKGKGAANEISALPVARNLHAWRDFARAGALSGQAAEIYFQNDVESPQGRSTRGCSFLISRR